MFLHRDLEKAVGLDGIFSRFVPFDPFHLTLMEYRPLDEAVLSANLDFMVTDGLSFTAFHRNACTLSFGIQPIWKGVAEIWMLVNRNIGKDKFIFHRSSKKLFPYIAECLQLVRLQCHVCAENVQAYRWIEKMVFNREGLLKHYGPEGRDYFVYARYFERI